MFRFPQVQQSAESFIDKDILGEADEGVEAEDIPMKELAAALPSQENGNPSTINKNPQLLPGKPIEDYEDNCSFRSNSVMTDIPEPPNARNFFDRLPSPNLSLNTNFTRPPYLNDTRRSGANTPTNGYRSANEVDQRRQQHRVDNEQLQRSASFNTAAARSNYNCFPPPPRQQSGDFNPYNQPPPNLQEPFGRGGDQFSHVPPFGPPLPDQRDLFSNHSTRDSNPTLDSPQQAPYINNQGFRTLPPQSFHSEPRRDRYDNGYGYGYAPYNNYNGMPQFRPRRVWRPPVTNNFNFINIPFNHQFYGYPQAAQQMIDMAQSAASLATLRTSYQHDYNIARNTQRIVPVKEENDDEISVVFEGPPKNPKAVVASRKRKSSNDGGSSSSLTSDDSITIETSSNATLTSTVPSKQSRPGKGRRISTSSSMSLPPHAFSSAPELTTYEREVETPIPQMIGLRIDTAPDPKNVEVEDGEIVDTDCTNSPKPTADIPLDRNPQFVFQQPQESALLPAAAATTTEELMNTSTTASTYDPSHPLYNPLLDEEDPLIANGESFVPADSINADDLLQDDDVESPEAKQARENEDHVLKQFPQLKLTETRDEKME